MKKPTLIVTVVSAVLMAAVIALASFFPISDEAKAEKFIKELGWEVSIKTYEVTSLKIPESFDEIYEEYNELQNLAGYDLEPFLGQTVDKYTYDITNFNSPDRVIINILIKEGEIIGGDITNVNVKHGFVIPLQKRDM